MKKCLILIFCLFCISAFSFSQESEEKSNFKHSLGAAAGFTTGVGLSYRYMPQRIGVQFTFAPIVGDYRKFFSGGGTILFHLVQNEKNNLFLYQGNHFYYNEYKYFMYHETPPYDPTDPNKDPYAGIDPTEVTTVERNWNNGLGIGFEMIISNRISFNIMAGYAAYRNFTRLSLTGEVGLYYKL